MKTNFLKLTLFLTLLFLLNQVILTGCVLVKKPPPHAGIEEADTSPPSPDTGQHISDDSLIPKAFFKADARYYYYMEAQLHRKQGEMDKAVDYLRKAMECDPTSSFLQKEMANLYLRQNDRQNALNVVEGMMANEPDNVESLIVYGRLKQELKQVDHAREAYEKVIAIDPKQKDVYLLLGNLHFEAGDMENASRVYEQLIHHFPDAYAGYFFLGKIHVRRGNLAEAEKKFKKTLDLEFDLDEPWFELAKIYDIQQKKTRVIRVYESILENDPDNIRAMIALAYFYHKNGNLKKAEELFKDLGTRSRYDPEIIRKVVQFYIDQEKYDPAITILEGMLRSAPDHSDIHYAAGIAFDRLKEGKRAIEHFKAVDRDSKFYHNAAVHISFLYQEQGNIREAIRFLKEVIEKVPDNPEFMIYLGAFYEETEEFQEAEKVLQKGLEIDPDNGRLYFRLGVVYDKWGKKEVCIDAMKEAIRLDPQNANALNYLGYTYADLGRNLDEAEDLIIKALEYKPDDGYVTDSLGWVYFKKGMFDKAVEILEKAVNLVPDDPIILEHLGDAYLKTNNKEKAIEFYKRSLEKKEEKDKPTLEDKIRELTGE